MNDHGRPKAIHTGPPSATNEEGYANFLNYLKANPDNLYQKQVSTKYGEQLLSIRWDPELERLITEHFEPDKNPATDEPGILWAPCGVLGRSETFMNALRPMIAGIIALRHGEELTYIDEKGNPIE